VHHLHTDSESGSAEKKDSDDKSMIYATEGTVTWQEQDIIAKVKISGGESGVKQTPTDCIIVSGGPPGDIDKHMLQKIIGDGQGKQKCPARKCRAQKKMGETR
jgi:hypothetical protein